MITNLSYNFLGMPRELEFKFMESGREDQEALVRTRDAEIKSGQLTLNEARSRAGMPLIEAPEADMPILVAGAGAFLVSEDGLKPLDASGGVGGLAALLGEPEQDGEVETPTEEDEDGGEEAQKELKKFLRFLKNEPQRSFNFRSVPVVYADVLNKFVSVGDYESARWYAERYLA
jgi:hypothetical protein